ncbi:MAG: ZIP family metal transporter [Planctomycetaceae bacterium]|nr:ZIP family metal transporter [Planctomycetaceae bacterium]
MQAFFYTSAGLGFIWLMTCLGAATVFLFRKAAPGKMQQVCLGFAAGVMMAASVWSLLLPAIEAAKDMGLPGWLPAAGGFILGVFFLFGLDQIIPHLHPLTNVREGLPSKSKRTTLLISAITLHNIPEGMAVGLAFALAAQNGGEPAIYGPAIALALGIGIQNFPEGAAVSLPLRQEGASTGKAFFMGSMSGVVEPVFGFLAVLLAIWVAPLMPWLLSFAAGAMIYVVVEELIPEANAGKHSHAGTMGVMAGFLVMMVLDVALG